MPRARAAKRPRRDVDVKPDSTSTAAQAKASSSYGSATEGVASNKECKFLELPSEILLEILSYFEPAVSMDSGEKAVNVLYPNGGEDTTTTTADINANHDHDNDNANSDSGSNDNGNGNGSAGNADTGAETPVTTYTYYYNEQRFLPGTAFSRTDSLRALSQTCVAWRNFFWPMIWENVELGSALRDGRGAWYRKLADGLIRKGAGIIADAEVAKRVKRIRVVLTRCDIPTVLPTLTSCLAACTNLKTLNIYFAHSEITTPLKDAFTGLDFPSVETIVLPTQAHQVLRCCPNVKKVVCNDGDASQLISAVKAKCKDVEVFEGIRPSWKKEAMVKRLVSAMPKLKQVRFEGVVDDKELQLFSSCKDLQLIQIIAVMSEREGIEERMSSTISILKNAMRPKSNPPQNASETSGAQPPSTEEKGKGKATRASQRSQSSKKAKEAGQGGIGEKKPKGKCTIIIKHNDYPLRWQRQGVTLSKWTKTIYV